MVDVLKFDELDKKYQKLVRPARSPKNKQVAEVIYQKGGYSVRSPSALGAAACVHPHG